jgi:two-component system CheB/CheR fusion protein
LPGRESLALLEEHRALPAWSAGKDTAASPAPPEPERLQQEADRLALQRYVPPGVLCDAELNVVDFRGDTSPFLSQPAGPPSIKLQKLARPSLLIDLSSAVEQARKENTSIRREGLRLDEPGGARPVDIEVIPMRAGGAGGLWFLIFFETPPPEKARGVSGGGAFWRGLRDRLSWPGGAESAPGDNSDRENRRLTQELEAARDYVRSVLDGHEAALEELKAAEEELLSSNEEFQSTNEELETAQEELQSSNDELRARNRELNTLNDELLQARDLAESIVETVHHPLLVLDRDLRVQQANGAFYRLFQTRPEATEKCRLFELAQGQWDIAALRRLLEEILPTHTSFENEEVTAAFPDLGERTLLCNGQALRWDHQERILLAVEDITDQRVALEAHKMIDRRKDDFLAMLAHELRNPLAPMRNALEIWRRGIAGEELERKAQAMLDRQLRQESRLIDDLLDLSRINRDTIVLKVEPVDLALLVSQVVEDQRPQVEANRHQLALALPNGAVTVKGDPARLRQIVSNLLANAIKYTPAGGYIEVSLIREGHDAVVKVADSGIGMSPEVLPTIFDLFMQADKSLARTQGGLGVGLTLVRRLVELHGGQVEARSGGIGQGSQFTVRLPVAQQAAAPSPSADSAPAPSEPLARRRILVVDDNTDTAESLAVLLEFEGHEVRTASDGSEALEAAKAFRPDIVLLDIGLPGLSGLEVAARLRALPELNISLLAAISGYGQEEDRSRSRAAGFDEHLVKPLELPQLLALIAAYPGNRDATVAD